ncbi:MAG: ATP-binding protein [Kofleriaceae bacterium]
MSNDLEPTSVGPSAVEVKRPFVIVLASPAAGDVGRILAVSSPLSIGRSSEADVVIEDPALSRRHIEIVPTDGGCSLLDLGSRNGTKVNGARISSVMLDPGDQIQVGATLLQFQDGSVANGAMWVRKALADNGVALWEYLPSSNELWFSEHIDTILDLPASTLGRKRLPLRACVHADEAAALERSLATSQGGAALELEVRLVIRPGSERWVRLRGHGATKASSTSGTVVDITGLKRRETTLSRTALMFESFLDGVALTNQAGAIVDLNSEMARVFSLSREAVIGQNVLAALPMADLEGRFRDAAAALADAGRWTATLQLESGTAFEVLAFPLRTDQGEEAGAVWVFRDVTEKQRMSSQIALLDRLAAMGTLSAGIAHEINNPLTYILGNAEFVRDSLAPHDEALVETVQEIVDGARRIAAIVRDLKMFSQADTGVEARAVTVESSISLAVKMTASFVRRRALVKVESTTSRLIEVVESRVVQVLINLMMNAAQAIPDGRADATILIRARDEGEGVAIEVIDDGVGMPPEVRSRAFDPFFTTKPMVGTGLGLSICHGLVTAMRGKIELDSSAGAGTTVRIWFPGAQERAREVAGGVAGAPRRASADAQPLRLRVLAIDDEPLLLRSIQRILPEHEVVTCGGYVEAIERLLRQRERYDVILCDLMMPDGNGVELHRELSTQRPELADRMVFITGGALAQRSQDFLRDTDNPCLMKPLDRQTLRQAVTTAHRS